jgi:hypothetical protein
MMKLTALPPPANYFDIRHSLFDIHYSLMNILLAQIILARRSEDADKWMNILFVVVLAVFWALGGILKARKSAQGRQKEQLARKPARRPPAPSSGLWEELLKEPRRPSSRVERQPPRPGVQQAHTKLAELRAAARKFAAEAEQAFRVQMAEPAPEPRYVLPKPETGPAAQVSPALAAKHPIAPEDKPAPGPLETLPEEYLAEILSDYADSDLTRRAILHYEILGRPLSLRDPQDPAIGL